MIADRHKRGLHHLEHLALATGTASGTGSGTYVFTMDRCTLFPDTAADPTGPGRILTAATDTVVDADAPRLVLVAFSTKAASAEWEYLEP